MTYYERHLPHWQPEGAALFITWRLHGSLPKAVAILDDQSPGRVFAAMDRENEHVAQCVVDALRYGERQLGLYQLRAWVLMVNHVHILIHPEAKLPRITKAIENYSARRANAILGRMGQPFWQDESYDHGVRSDAELEKIVRYIEQNPVATGLVTRVDAWRWSSAFGTSE